MPPRTLSLPRLGTTTLCLRPALKPAPSWPLQLTKVANASARALRQKYRDPYALAQAQQRKAANVKRQVELRKQREQALGDPVRGIETPFLKSFDDAAAPNLLDPQVLDGGEAEAKSADVTPLNHFLKPSEVRKALQSSFILTQPAINTNRDLLDPAIEAEKVKQHADAHERATAAVARILSLANGSQKSLTRANVQRCIETFGRHNTDEVLKPREPSTHIHQAEKTPRAGPDTGSSEVQIAILTAKIRVLANGLEKKRCQKDKMNKRNLRLMVHRRQKLLAYLRQKERGGERWQNIVETLGLTDGTWKGEISL